VPPMRCALSFALSLQGQASACPLGKRLAAARILRHVRI
jgi:hypothetical protein